MRHVTWFLLGLFLSLPVRGGELPRGTILAFLPDPGASEYHDDASLRRWLKAQGWAICDGRDGTPDLNYRMLLGATRMQMAGKRQGSRRHRHRFQGQTRSFQGRQVSLMEGRGPGRWLQVPVGGHKHRLEGATDAAEHLPLSVGVLFIMKIR
ncbi:hypothetical protein MIN45_P1261 [Methylomarinovum tepidoasis]|uniref:Uncharacterized protein n=1 Tax=Methylomarinovum tepidoasis TaxID=2840183 RepID=A0AAU9CDL0_9GAMM|nr:hypothetical protein [Methylomarinovum sp. IN45]BCX88891.1 hypothetical protein MIN45_P1261 [Methylomarinovum sp. IN45]